MSLRISPPAPQDMRDAMHVLTNPARHRAHPAVIQTNWAFLKMARGQTVDFDRIGAPAHLMAFAVPVLAATGPRPVMGRLAAFFGGDAA